jgi:HlyD family secretion protein
MNQLAIFLQGRSLKQVSLIVLAIVVLAGGAWFWYRNHQNSNSFRTAPLLRGDLQATISATGTVEPEEVVDVGAQVAGKIVAFGQDKDGKVVDYGSVVEAGTVLAQIDDALYAADLANAKAQLEQNKANVKRAEADLGQLKARLYQAQRDWMRAQKLGPSDALSQADYDAALSAYDIAKANVKVGEAALVQAKDAVLQAEAVLRKAAQNLDYCTIKSPVKGVIIDRRVNIGQTVVASLNAPSLFLIAKDLKRLQVWASVNEADIGSISPRQPVTFTVDAHPGDVFQGEVGKVRLNATMTQNVVTYTVEVNTDNSDGKLIPYLTANLRFMVAERQDVLMVPNAALRWAPLTEQIAPKFRRELAKSQDGNSGGKNASSTRERKGRSRLGTVWLAQGRYVQPVAVRLGLSDGSFTEVQSPELKEGVQVVLGEQQQGNGSGSTASPFTPQLFRGNRR